MNEDRSTNANRRARPRGVPLGRPKVDTPPAKDAGAIVCADCGAVRHAGRWTFRAPPLAETRSGRCPACQRIADRAPAGTLRIPATFLAQRDEVLNLIRNVEEQERAEHPLERVMGVDEEGGRMTVTTTGIHIARQIANRLARRFHRKAHVRYADEESRVDVDWD